MEQEQSLESENKSLNELKERAINAYKQFIDKGITTPDHLDLDDAEVKKANLLYYEWQVESNLSAGNDDEKRLRASIDKGMFFIDAGFTDNVYLQEVVNVWLLQDSEHAEKDADNLERKITRQKIANAIKKIRGILNSQKN